MPVSDPSPVPHAATDGGDRSDVRMIYGASYLLFLLVAIGRRLTPGRRRAGPARRGSVFAEAKAGAATYVPFAFMG